MDDLSTYQWLVLGLLTVIAICAMMVVGGLLGLDDLADAMTKRLERAIDRLRKRDEEP